MAITLGTNLASLNIRFSLNEVSGNYNSTMEKLSTGLKINRAGDDAAGLVISENMEAEIRGTKQAMANIQNAKSYLTIAEDGMVSIGDHFQRINDLLTNMANDTNDIKSRTAAIDEIIERLKEINRLADSVNFNGRPMLDGTAQEIVVQMGADETNLSTLEISGALTDCHVSVLLGTTGVLLPEYLDPTSADFEPNNENCRAYMALVQEAISDIAQRRGLLGAYENRMESSYDSLTTRIQSLEAAKSIYTDTDIAEEATNMTKGQILQQINVSLLAQANQSQGYALSLLGG